MSYLDNFKDVVIFTSVVMKIYDTFKKGSTEKWFKNEGFWNYSTDENSLSTTRKYYEIVFYRKQPSGLQTGFISDDSNVNMLHKNMYQFEVQKIILGISILRKEKNSMINRKLHSQGLTLSFRKYLLCFGFPQNDIGLPKFLMLYFDRKSRNFFF